MRGCLLASAALLCSGTAFAQEATPQANDQTGSATEALAEDIVVTATKKGYGESVQKVPMAVTAFGEAQLDAKFVQHLQSLSYDVPNVQLEDVGTAPGYANFTIRGLGINSTIPSIDPTVGVFTDGIYLGINAGVVLDNFDLEGIEVLRGPQGLLFGRNVTGGAVVVRTTRPSFDFGAKAKLSIETGLKKTVSGTVTGPIVDDVLAAKLAVYYSDDNGWFRNRFDNRSFGKSHDLIIRPALSLKGGDRFRMDLRYEHGDVESDGAPVQSHALFPATASGFRSISQVSMMPNGTRRSWKPTSMLVWAKASSPTSLAIGNSDPPRALISMEHHSPSFMPFSKSTRINSATNFVMPEGSVTSN